MQLDATTSKRVGLIIIVSIIKMSGLLGKGGMPISDGSWTLTVFVTDLQVERSLRVRGDLHIGGVMIRLVDDLGKRAEYVTTIYFF